MFEQKKLIVSHAPFWHNGSRVTVRSYHTMLAALPAVLGGIYFYGIPVIGVVCLSVATAVIWELAINLVTKRPITFTINVNPSSSYSRVRERQLSKVRNTTSSRTR